MIGRVAVVVLSLAVGAVGGTLAGNSHSYSQRRVVGRDMKQPTVLGETMVKATLSNLVYGFRSCCADIVLSSIAPDAVFRTDEFVSSLKKFCRSIDDGPVLEILDPKITTRGGTAEVRCQLIWRWSDKNGRRTVLRIPERMLLRKSMSGPSRYRITRCEALATVIRHSDSPQGVRRAMIRTRLIH